MPHPAPCLETYPDRQKRLRRIVHRTFNVWAWNFKIQVARVVYSGNNVIACRSRKTAFIYHLNLSSEHHLSWHDHQWIFQHQQNIKAVTRVPPHQSHPSQCYKCLWPDKHIYVFSQHRSVPHGWSCSSMHVHSATHNELHPSSRVIAIIFIHVHSFHAA